MFDGTPEDLKQTKVTNLPFSAFGDFRIVLGKDFKPDMVAGHSLGEFSALVAAKALSSKMVEMVYKRALTMQKACEMEESTMAAVLGLSDEDVKRFAIYHYRSGSTGKLQLSGTIGDFRLCGRYRHGL